MAGHFYPPPPTFVGGRQPYAPALGIAQSGPAPSTDVIPFTRLNYNIYAAWRYDPVTVISLVSIAPGLPTAAVPDAAPITTPRLVYQTLTQWVPAFSMPPRGALFAPLVQTPIIPDAPPKNSYANLNRILNAWVPPYRPLPRLTINAPVIPPPPVVAPLKGLTGFLKNLGTGMQRF